MKYLKLFECFCKVNEMDDEPSYYVLTDGRFLYFDSVHPRQEGKDEKSYYTYWIGTQDKFDIEDCEKTTFEEIKDLLSKEDLEQHTEEIKDLN